MLYVFLGYIYFKRCTFSYIFKFSPTLSLRLSLQMYVKRRIKEHNLYRSARTQKWYPEWWKTSYLLNLNCLIYTYIFKISPTLKNVMHRIHVCYEVHTIAQLPVIFLLFSRKLRGIIPSASPCTE